VTRSAGPRIREITAVPVDAGDRPWLFVKVATDEPGLVGWGEATLGWQARAVTGQLADLAEVLVGEPVLRTEHLWQTGFRSLFYRGGPVAMSALAGVDIALWDLKGQVLGVPVHVLLGGPVRDRVRCYDHLYRWALGLDFDSMAGQVEAARRSVADGFDAIKLYPVPPGPPLHPAGIVNEVVERVGAIRDAVGDGVDIMIDMHGRTTPAQALAYAHALAPLRPLFLEEPCAPGDAAGMAQVARASPVPVATGERLHSRWDVRDLLELRACAVLQPDVANAGGLSEVRRIAAMAEPYSVAIAPHCPAGPIATAATVHLSVALPNLLIMEQLREDVPWRDEIVDRPPRPVGGHFDVPTAPGLGVAVTEEAAAEHPPGRSMPYRSQAPDGSVVDD
jgi:galactonate dehydratase